jgi:hypothetical protein
MRAFAYKQAEESNVHDLARAAEAGDARLVEELLAAGAAVNEAAADGMTALMFAAASGRMDILSLLLARGADINVVRKDGVTALGLGAFFGHHQIVRELVARGADAATIGRFRAALEEWARERGWAGVTPEPMMEDSESEAGEGLPQQDIDSADSKNVNLAAETPLLSLTEAIAPARETSSGPVVLAQKAIAQPRLLDESAVLPSEASYATVPLHRDTIIRPRVLDESAVLPSEASYATVALHQKIAAPSDSTRTEFLTNLLIWKRLGVPLICVAVSAAALALFLKFSTVRGIFQSLQSENTTTATPAARTKSSPAKSQVVADSNSAKPLFAPVSQQRANELPPGTAASTFNQTVVANSDVPAQPAAAEATKPRATSSRKPKPRPIESDRAKEDVGAGKVAASDSTSKKAVITSEDPAGIFPASAASEKSSSDSPVKPTSGGAERPRRVTPVPPSQSQSVISAQPKNSKTKVIRWP